VLVIAVLGAMLIGLSWREGAFSSSLLHLSSPPLALKT